MKTLLYIVLVIIIVGLIIFLISNKTQTTTPIRQSQEIRTQTDLNDQEAVKAIEENLP